MDIKQSEYDDAIVKLLYGKTQLEPDGRNCVICGDDDHQAFECHHNLIVIAKQKEPKWRCFHCNEIFDDVKKAEEHFGLNNSEIPKCVSQTNL